MRAAGLGAALAPKDCGVESSVKALLGAAVLALRRWPKSAFKLHDAPSQDDFGQRLGQGPTHCSDPSQPACPPKWRVRLCRGACLWAIA